MVAKVKNDKEEDEEKRTRVEEGKNLSREIDTNYILP